MMHLFLADGFEEIEAFTTLDILRRLGLDVRVTSISGARSVTGAHGIAVMADTLFRSVEVKNSEAFIFPGGMPGAKLLKQCDVLRKLIVAHHEEGKLLAAICAAPIVLANAGVLENKMVTCYPGFEKELTGADVRDALVVVDGNIITAKGPGASVHFALAIAERFVGAKQIEKLKADMFLA